MAKGLPDIPREEEAQAGSYGDTYPDGLVKLVGISKVITVDDKEQPIFKLMDNQLKIGLQFDDGTGKGPAGFMSPAYFWALMNAVGKDVTGIKYQERTSTDLILDFIKDPFPRPLSLSSKNGYVNVDRSPDVAPLRGKYTVKFTAAHNKTFKQGDYEFSAFEGKNGTFYSLTFDYEIVSDGKDRPTIFEGYVHKEWYQNPFTDVATGATGTKYDAVEQGTPVYARTPNGGIPMLAKRWQEFTKYFAPSVFEHEWEVDAEKSPYGVSEVLKPQYVIIELALKDKREVVISLKPKDKGNGMYFDLLDLYEFNEPEELDVPSEDAWSNLVNFIVARWSELNLFEDAALGLKGKDFKEWANNVLLGGGELSPWVQSGQDMNVKKDLYKLTEQEQVNLLIALKDRYPMTEENW